MVPYGAGQHLRRPPRLVRRLQMSGGSEVNSEIIALASPTGTVQRLNIRDDGVPDSFSESKLPDQGCGIRWDMSLLLQSRPFGLQGRCFKRSVSTRSFVSN